MDYKNNKNYDNWGNPTYDYLVDKLHMDEILLSFLGTHTGFTKAQAKAVLEEVENRWGYYGVNSITEIDEDDEDKRLEEYQNQFQWMFTKRSKALYNKYKYIIDAYDSINKDLISKGVIYQSDMKRTPDLTHSSKNTDYALPNSKVGDIRGNPTEFNENVRTEEGQETHHTETQGGVNLLDQTIRYIRGMKISWVNDFVEELKPCFCTLYL